MDNPTDYIMVSNASDWCPVQFYDDNTDSVIFNYYRYSKSFVPRIIINQYSPKLVGEEQHEIKWFDKTWKTNTVTRDQWNKFLATLRMLTVALEASIQQPLVKYRDYTFFPLEANSLRSYTITKHCDDLISVSVTYSQHEHVIPYSPNIEEIIKRFLSEVTTTMDNWLNLNQPSFDS